MVHLSLHPTLERSNILILVDAAINWPEAVTMTSQRANKVADEIIRLFSRLGLPWVIRSDLSSNLSY